MTWLTPSIIAMLCGSGVLTLVFGFLYHQDRERHMGIWALGWFCHMVSSALTLAQKNRWITDSAETSTEIALLLSGLLLLWGTTEMVQRKLAYAWGIGGGLCVWWILFGKAFLLPHTLQHLPIYFFYAAVSIYTGLTFLRSPELGHTGKQLTGWSLIVLGLHTSDNPFLRPVEWFAPWGFLLTAILSLTVAIGMLLVYFERIRTTLSASEARFRTLVEQSTDGMFLLNLEGRILDANRHACQSLGYSKEELLQLNLHDIVEGLTDIILPRRPNRLAPGVPSTLDGRHRRRDGSGFPVDIRISVIESSTAELQLLALARDVSKQKETEDLLRQSGRKFEALYNQAFQLVGLLNPEGLLLDANQTALQLIGAELPDVQGRPFWETPWWNHDPRQQRQLRQAIQRAAEGEMVRMEAIHHRPDGTWILVDTSLKPIVDDAGQVILLIAEGRDITERIHFENSLKAINIKLEALVDASPMPIVAIDRQGRTAEWNRAAEQTFGWRREEVIGQPYPLVPESEMERELALRRRVFSGENLRGIEVLRQKKDGSTLELDMYAAPLPDAEGNVSGGMAMFVDRHEQRQAENALRESEARYRKLYHQFEILLNGIPDPITLVDRDMTIVWANQGAATAFNCEQAQISGQQCYRFWHDRDAICTECPVIDCFNTGEFQEHKTTTADGRIWGVKVFPIRDKDGGIVNTLQLATEITEKIRLREEADRTSRLASLGELAAGVAHEINNPNGLTLLNLPMLIEAFADMERALEQYAEQHSDFTIGGLPFSRMRVEIPEMLEELREGATRIKRIVEDLKNFVRQDHLAANQEVDLNQALQTAVRLTTTEIRRSTDLFSASYSGDLAPVQGISQRLEQVLVNLIINACQALPDKNCSLTLATRYDAACGMNVVEVRDQGRGIEEKHLKHLTDPFFTTRRESGGTGLGLSVSARIVKEHRGELRFDSTAGVGTRVTLLLPPMKEVYG